MYACLFSLNYKTVQLQKQSTPVVCTLAQASPASGQGAIKSTRRSITVLPGLVPFGGLFGLFFQPEQCFSLTTIQPEQYFSASFSQSSDQRTGPYVACGDRMSMLAILCMPSNRRCQISWGTGQGRCGDTRVHLLRLGVCLVPPKMLIFSRFFVTSNL